MLLSVLAGGLAGCFASNDDVDDIEGDVDVLEAEVASLANGKAIELTILHMNDNHSHLEAETFDFDVSGLGLEARDADGNPITEVEVSYGGFPNLVSLARAVESQTPNLLKVHAGDAVTGTLFYTLYNGVADAALMNQVCFDVFALGNHEFDGGDAGLANFLDALNASACNTAALAANVVPAETSAVATGYIQPYVIKEIEGEPVALIGLDIAQKTKESSRPDAGTVFLDEVETAQAVIDELETLGIDKIILVTHFQFENDLALASQVRGVDVIVGGDSHTLLGSEALAELGFNPVGDYPTMTADADGNPVCVVHAWEYAHLMGKLSVSFDAEGVVSACEGVPIIPVEDDYVYDDGTDADPAPTLSVLDGFKVTQALTQFDEVAVVEPDATTTALLASLNEEKAVLEQTVIGTVADDLCLERFPGQARSSLCNVAESYVNGSDISNIVAKAFLTVTPTADIAIQNGGGVRVDVAAGDYSIADAFTLLPFSNTLVTLELTGQQIVDVLEEALANPLDNGGSTGSYPYASGLRYHIDASAAFGGRVSNVEVNARLAGPWTAIDLNATYTVVTNDFIASGQDGYETFGEIFATGEFVDTFTEYAQGFIDYVEGLATNGQSVQKLPVAEYSTQQYIGRDGCNHSAQVDCDGY